MLEKNGAGYRPEIEDVNPPADEDDVEVCNKCGGDMDWDVFGVNPSGEFKCTDCGNVNN